MRNLTLILNQIDFITNEPLWYSSSQTCMVLRDVFSTFFPFPSMLKHAWPEANLQKIL